jgi:hypothetical protein
MSVLDARKVSPFKVKRRIGKVAFELELPAYIKIYLVISYVYLELALLEHLDKAPPPPSILVGGEERYIINRIVRKERRRHPRDKTRRLYYRVR